MREELGDTIKRRLEIISSTHQVKSVVIDIRATVVEVITPITNS